MYGPPLKFDVSLPLSAIGEFAAESGDLVAEHAPDAIPVLFGHIGEGNLHLNVLRCGPEAERELYSAMMDADRPPRRQRQLRARRRHPQARLRVDVAHRRRHRRDAHRQERLRPVGLPEPRGAVRHVASVAAGHRVPAVAARRRRGRRGNACRWTRTRTAVARVAPRAGDGGTVAHVVPVLMACVAASRMARMAAAVNVGTVGIGDR